MGGWDVDTKELVVLHLSVKAMDEIQKVVVGTQEDVEIETQEEVTTQEPNSSQLNVEAIEG